MLAGRGLDDLPGPQSPSKNVIGAHTDGPSVTLSRWITVMEEQHKRKQEKEEKEEEEEEEEE